MRDRSIAMTVLTALLVLAVVSLGGCGMSQDAAADSVKAHLEEKYGEEFVIEASGGGFGTADNTTWKVIFHPASDPALKSYATIPKGGGDIKDYYTGARAARDYARSVEAQIATLIEARVHISIDVRYMTGDGSENGGPDLAIHDFIEQNPGVDFLVGVLTDADLTDEAVDQVLADTGQVMAVTIPRGRLFLASVDSATFDEMISSPATSEMQDVEAKASAWVNISESEVSSPIRR